MKAEEANKIIAEYMGYEIIQYKDRGMYNPNGEQYFISQGDDKPSLILYTNMLDALVPVWCKINDNPKSQNFDYIGILNMTEHNEVFFGKMASEEYDSVTHQEVSSNQSVQELAAIATAKAIQDLECEG